jgi:ketosteroid isomerase-like protein
MRPIRPFLLLTAVACAIPLQARAQSAPPATNSELTRFGADYRRSLLEGKPELIESYYADTMRLMPEFQHTIKGRINALLYRKAFLARFAVSAYDRNTVEALDLGRKIAEFGLFNMKIKLKSTGKEYDLNGKYEDVWDKGRDGHLKLVTEAWNYDRRVEIGDQLRFDAAPSVNVALQAQVQVNNNVRFELAALNAFAEQVITQHDAKLWSRLYSDDIKYIYSNNPAVEGRQAMDAFLERHVKELPTFEKLSIRNDEIDDLGEYVVEYASHIAVFRSGDYSGVSTGKDLRIWRREKDGFLKVCRSIAMYD